MRQPINSDRRHKFIELVGNGLDPYEAYPLAGYATSGSESGWKANCRSLCGRLRSEIDAVRAANSLPGSKKKQTGDLSDEETAELLAETRAALEVAKAQDNVGAQTKLLKQLLTLTRKSARGRPASAGSPASAKPARKKNMFDHMSGDQIWDLAFSITETDQDRAQHAAEAERWRDYEEQRALAINGLPNRFATTPFPGAAARTLEGGTVVIDFEEPDQGERAKLESSAAQSASVPEVVKRL